MDFLIEFDYKAEENDELSLQKGNIVNNVKFYEDGWLVGTFKGKTGVFPSNFGKEIKLDSNKNNQESSAVIINDDNVKLGGVEQQQGEREEVPLGSPHVVSQGVEESPVAKVQPHSATKKVIGVGFGDIFSGKQIQLKYTAVGESKIQTPDDDYLKTTDLNVDKKPNVIGSVTKVELVKASYSYKAENPDELQIEEGDIITIIDKKSTDEGWWKGKLNGKIGVFPNNFVVPHSLEEITAKPIRPAVVNKVQPPAPLTAKPNSYKPKPAPTRPPNPDPVKVFSKTNVKSFDTEKEEISFESTETHKPLVGPTAERVRRPNIRLPKKISESKTADIPVSTDVTGNITPSRQKSLDITSSENIVNKTATLTRRTPTLKEKPIENALSEPKSVSIDRTATLKERFSETTSSSPETTTATTANKFLYTRDKSKEATLETDTTSSRQKIVQDKTVVMHAEPQDNLKNTFRPKSQLYNNTFVKENDQLKTDDQDRINKKIVTLESKISELEEAKSSLENNITEIKKNTAEHISQLTNKLEALMKDFVEEKRKRAVADSEIAELQLKVDNLELSTS